jgi:hypothetical protein
MVSVHSISNTVCGIQHKAGRFCPTHSSTPLCGQQANGTCHTENMWPPPLQGMLQPEACTWEGLTRWLKRGGAGGEVLLVFENTEDVLRHTRGPAQVSAAAQRGFSCIGCFPGGLVDRATTSASESQQLVVQIFCVRAPAMKLRLAALCRIVLLCCQYCCFCCCC